MCVTHKIVREERNDKFTIDKVTKMNSICDIKINGEVRLFYAPATEKTTACENGYRAVRRNGILHGGSMMKTRRNVFYIHPRSF